MKATWLGMLLTAIGMSAATESGPPLHNIEFDTDEGTWMCVDVSPDGKTLVFDLLGDLYTLPIDGGKATPLLTGRAWDTCPRYSPDGQRLSFISDRGGVPNVWALELRTHEVRQISRLKSVNSIVGAIGTPEWLPNGREITYGIYRLGMPIQVVSLQGGESRALIPEWKVPEGKLKTAFSIAFSSGRQGAFFSVREIAPGEIAIGMTKSETYLSRWDMATGQVTRLTEAIAGRDEFKPQTSRSGRFLAYVRSNGFNDTELRVRDLKNGSDRRLTRLVDAEEAWSNNNIYGDEFPAYAFTPDDRFIVIWYTGKLHRVSVEDGSSTIIPFNVHVVRQVAEPIRFHHRISDGPLEIKALRWPVLSPDLRKLVFSAVGSLWICELPDGQPRRLTHSDDFEYMPKFSTDGKSLAYIAFSHTRDTILPPGRLMILRLDTGEAQSASSDSASYYMPSWSPDSTKIAVVRETGESGKARAQFGWVDLTSRSFHSIAPAHSYAHGDIRFTAGQHVSFSQDGKWVLFQQGGAGYAPIRLQSVGLDGSDLRTLATAGNDVWGIFPSPDLSQVLLLGKEFEAYVLPLHETSQLLSTKDREAQKVSDHGALFPSWVDRDAVVFGWTNEIYLRRSGELRGALLRKVDLTVPRRGGRGVVAFRNARLITVNGEHGAGSVIERGTIVVRNRRIEAVGPLEEVAIPDGAEVIDATGLTIMPGLVESHIHGITQNPHHPLSIPVGSLRFSAALAFGITTAWEAHGPPDDGSLSMRELVEAGRLRGQRWLAAGGQLSTQLPGEHYGSFGEVQDLVQKRVNLGAGQCLKNRFTPDRLVSQWYSTAAWQSGVCVVTHTNYPGHLLSHAGDGEMVDHATLPSSYRDIIQFLAKTGVIWTPNVIISASTRTPPYSVKWAFVEEMRDREDQQGLRKLRMYGAAADLEQLSKASVVPYAQSAVAREARVAGAVLAAGGRIAASSDNVPLLTQFEMWALSRGGMGPGEAIRAGTMTGAEKLGIQDDVGSLTVGKLADLLILTANPLERIENSLSIKYTVLAGIVYDSDTLNVVWPQTTGSIANPDPTKSPAQKKR